MAKVIDFVLEWIFLPALIVLSVTGIYQPNMWMKIILGVYVIGELINIITSIINLILSEILVKQAEKFFLYAKISHSERYKKMLMNSREAKDWEETMYFYISSIEEAENTLTSRKRKPKFTKKQRKRLQTVFNETKKLLSTIQPERNA